MPFLTSLKKSNKTLGIIFLVSFLISVLFPVVASVMNKKGEVMTAGYYDVAIAFICFLLFILLYGINRESKNNPEVMAKAQQITDYICSIPLLLIGLYFIQIDLNWPILLIGLGWRFFLLITALPYLIHAFSIPR